VKCVYFPSRLKELEGLIASREEKKRKEKRKAVPKDRLKSLSSDADWEGRGDRLQEPLKPKRKKNRTYLKKNERRGI